MLCVFIVGFACLAPLPDLGNRLLSYSFATIIGLES